MNLAQALGYGAEDKLLIVNADDFGICHAVNRGIQQLLSEQAVSSATVMMPCPWAKDAVHWAAAHPGCDVGVHLTFTSEWNGYKWGPVTRDAGVGSLVTPEGYFPADCASFERQADEAEVRREIVRQIEMAVSMGLSPTHLDNHMGSLYGLATGRNFLAIVFEICVKYGYPFRMPRYPDPAMRLPDEAVAMAAMLAAQADAAGVVILDYLKALPYEAVPGETYEQYREQMAALLRSLQPGVTELILHPSLVTEELQAINPHWQRRGMEFELFRDPWIHEVLQGEGIRMIRWADLQRLQRA